MNKQIRLLPQLTVSFLLVLLLSGILPSGSGESLRSISGCGLDARSAAAEDFGEISPYPTGRPLLDRAIQTDVMELQRQFGVVAKMFLVREKDDPNAFALSKEHDGVAQILSRFRVQEELSRDG